MRHIIVQVTVNRSPSLPMSIPNPYEQAAKLAATAPALEALAREYWAVGEPLCGALVAADAGFDDTSSTYTAFVALGRELRGLGFVSRLKTSLESRHRNVSQDERRKAIFGVYEMTLAGVYENRERFDRAFAVVTSHPEAAVHLRQAFREAGDMWVNWVYCPHVADFRHRAVAILTRAGSELNTDTPRGFPARLSVEAADALTTWAEWDSRSEGVRPIYRIRTTPNGVACTPATGFPAWAALTEPKRQPDEVEPDRPDKSDRASREREELPAEFVFAPSGTGYLVRGFGESGHLSNLRGLQDVELLLRSAGRPVAMDVLDGRGPDTPAERRTVQPAFDVEALLSIQKEIARLEGEVATADNDVDRDDSQQRLDQLRASANPAINVRGGSRDLNDPIAKLRPKIHDRMKTVFRKMRESNPPMRAIADHLDVSIRADGRSFIYEPSNQPPAWQFELR